MSQRDVSIGAIEAIRIAEKYLPSASIDERKALAMEIVEAIALSEEEFSQEIIQRIETAAAGVQ